MFVSSYVATPFRKKKTSKAMTDRGKRGGEDGNTKISISQEQKELFR